MLKTNVNGVPDWKLEFADILLKYGTFLLDEEFDDRAGNIFRYREIEIDGYLTNDKSVFSLMMMNGYLLHMVMIK